MSPAGMKALDELLRSLFSVDELRRFVTLLPGENLSAELPDGSVSLAAFTFEVVGVLKRHKRLDDTFFELLEHQRPARHDEIARVRELVLSSMESVRPRPEPSTARNAGTAEPLDLLAEKIEEVLARKRRLESLGLPTEDILAELLELKREHRRGGQLRRGDALGERYLLTEQIGRGGFATVWKARDTTSGDEVAIKVLHPELAGDKDRRRRFFRGARIMAELAHPLVVSIRERKVEDDGFFYFVMDFVPGGNLQDAVLEQRVNREHAVSIILGIGQALAEAHRRGHAHRDVKPLNILLTASGTPRLTDFDLVTAMDTTGGTRTGPLGTFLYAAPEMMERPQDADTRADVYALGMTMAFLLHGNKLPRKALTARGRFIASLPATPAIKGVLKRATAEDPEDRYPDATAFCDALRAVIPQVNPLKKDAQTSRRGKRTARVRPLAPPPPPSEITARLPGRDQRKTSQVVPSARLGWLVPGAALLPVLAMIVGIWATGPRSAIGCLSTVSSRHEDAAKAGIWATWPLSASEIDAGVNTMRARLEERCNGMGRGEVELTVQVAAQTGLVEDVTVKSSPNAALGNCAAETMMHATFARGKQGTTFTIPLGFHLGFY